MTPAEYRTSQSEAQFMRDVIAWADSRKDRPGFPDLVMVRDGMLLFWELKAARGRVRPEQGEWLMRLGAVEAVEAEVMRPADWESMIKRLM
jgi:hypothetical protein